MGVQTKSWTLSHWDTSLEGPCIWMIYDGAYQGGQERKLKSLIQRGIHSKTNNELTQAMRLQKKMK